jgi:hypothetical protein
MKIENLRDRVVYLAGQLAEAKKIYEDALRESSGIQTNTEPATPNGDQ